jgi:hypothetical protein
MIEKDDLRAAVQAGVLSEAQAVNLSALAQKRLGSRTDLDPGDEPFELFKGFNEIFIVVGLGILAAGWVFTNLAAAETEIINYRTMFATTGATAAVVIWLLSEYFIRRRRMVAPAIALSIMFAVNAVVGLTGYFAQPFMIAQEEFRSLPMPVAAATLATVVFWFRFKVPFAMALIAVALFALSVLVAANSTGTPTGPSDLFLLSANGPFAWITLVLGLAVFAVALAFDMSDPHRVTRRSAQGFWLHVVAAPALVNTIALSLLARETGTANLILVAVLALFAFVAIVIDRRSFLIAAIGYIVALASTVFEGEAAATTILGLGVFLVFLGAFWERIRARLLGLLPSSFPLDKLPPSYS